MPIKIVAPALREPTQTGVLLVALWQGLWKMVQSREAPAQSPHWPLPDPVALCLKACGRIALPLGRP